jgi:Beta-lactamase
MAKSITSALIGIAIDEGLIASVDDPVTMYIPELRQKDPRFDNITIKNLLTVSSGLEYVEQGLPWSDDTKTYYDTDLRSLAFSSIIEEEPVPKLVFAILLFLFTSLCSILPLLSLSMVFYRLEILVPEG